MSSEDEENKQLADTEEAGDKKQIDPAAVGDEASAIADIHSEIDSEEDQAAAQTVLEAPGSASSFHCVAVGASAGGLEAITALLRNLEPNGSAAIIVAQHMAPQHRSLLAELLAKDCAYEVVNVTDGTEIEPDKVYVNPPNCDVIVEEGKIRTVSPTIEIGPRPSIDKLLQTVAAYYGNKAVAVILSGTGSDGTLGAKSIRDGGGITIAQTPETAKFDGMPGSVIRAKLADMQLSPEEIASYVIQVASQSDFPERKVSGEHFSDDYTGPLRTVINVVLDETGIDFSGYKRATLERQLMRRVVAMRFSKVEDYLEYLVGNPGEVDILQRSFLISVTGFFRDLSAFEELRKEIEKFKEQGLLERGLRIWVPACATGEEVYTIAIMLSEAFPKELRKSNIRIYATDIDDIALETARRGLYPESVVESLPTEIIYNYFEPEGSSFRIRKWLRDMCMFARHDVTKDPPFLRMDFISCRNLMIFLNNDMQRTVLGNFHYSLVPQGLLFLGKSESVNAEDLFAPIDKDARIYRSRPGVFSTGRVNMPAGLVPRMTSENRVRTRRDESSDTGKMTLLQRFVPPTVIVDESLKPLEFIGDLGPYMSLPKGRAEFDLLALCNPQLQVELRAILGRVRRSEESVLERTLSYRLPGSGEVTDLKLIVAAMGAYAQSGGYTITFSPQARVVTPAVGPGDSEATQGEYSAADYMALDEELKRTQDHLQAVIEELETSNEELQSLNEELQASTEELQASNEELETTNEELQATNEELSTVNDELQAKSMLLTEANETLNNIQNSLDLGIVLVDKDLRIKRFTPQVLRLFGIMDGDVGQRLSRIPSHIDVPKFDELIDQVITEGMPRRIEVSQGDSRYLVSISPYRSDTGSISGGVITFSEITELTESLAQLAMKDALLARVGDTLNVGVWTGQPGYQEVMWLNDRIERIVGRGVGLLRSDPSLLFDLVHPEDRQKMRDAYTDTSSNGWNLRYRFHRRDDSVIWVEDVAARYSDPELVNETMVGYLRELSGPDD